MVGTVCIGALMGQLDASIVTLAFPTFRHSFNASLGSVQWVGQSYLLVVIALVAPVGRYADMVGRKLLYTYGFVFFIVGSALCGAAPGLPALIGFRLVQGLGAAMLQANSVAIIASSVPRRQLGRAIGIQGAAQALGLALGPAVGGLLIAAGGWRLIFFVNVPFGIVGATLGWFLLPRSRNLAARAAFDWAGLAIFAPAVITLLLAVSYGNDEGWASGPIVGLFVAGAVLAGAYILHERRTASPMLDLSLFRRLSFSAGIASGLLSYVVLFGALTVVPFLLEVGRDQSTGVAGSELLLLPLAIGLVAPASGQLADRIGPRPLTTAGMVLAAAAFLASAVVHDHLALFLVTLGVAGVGLGAFTPPNNAAVMAAAPTHQSGMAGGVLNMTRGIGTSLGLALASLAYTVGAGTRTATPHQAASGYVDAAMLLAGAAAAAAVMAASRRTRGAAPPPPVATAVAP